MFSHSVRILVVVLFTCPGGELVTIPTRHASPGNFTAFCRCPSVSWCARGLQARIPGGVDSCSSHATRLCTRWTPSYVSSGMNNAPPWLTNRAIKELPPPLLSSQTQCLYGLTGPPDSTYSGDAWELSITSQYHT